MEVVEKPQSISTSKNETLPCAAKDLEVEDNILSELGCRETLHVEEG